MRRRRRLEDAAEGAKEARENAHPKGRKNDEKADDTKSRRLSRRWMPGFLKRRFDEKDTYQQLDISPAAHAGLVFAATFYYAWNARVRSAATRWTAALRKTARRGAASLGHRRDRRGRHGGRRDPSFAVGPRRAPRAAASDVSRRYDATARSDRREGEEVEAGWVDGRLAARRRRRKRRRRGEPSASLIAQRSTSWGDERNRREGKAETTGPRRRGDDARAATRGVHRDRTRRTSATRRRPHAADPKRPAAAVRRRRVSPRAARTRARGPLRGVPRAAPNPTSRRRETQDARQPTKSRAGTDTATGGPAADDERASSGRRKKTTKVTAAVAPRRRGDAEETETRGPTRTDDERTSTVPTLDLDRGMGQTRGARATKRSPRPGLGARTHDDVPPRGERRATARRGSLRGPAGQRRSVSLRRGDARRARARRARAARPTRRSTRNVSKRRRSSVIEEEERLRRRLIRRAGKTARSAARGAETARRRLSAEARRTRRRWRRRVNDAEDGRERDGDDRASVRSRADDGAPLFVANARGRYPSGTGAGSGRSTRGPLVRGIGVGDRARGDKCESFFTF